MIGGNSGSPLQARLDINVSKTILVVLAVAAVIAVIYAISRLIHSYYGSSSYLEKKKNRPTTLPDINEIAAKCGLTKEEKKMLHRICYSHRTPNILYLVRDTEQFDMILKEHFKTLDEASNEPEKMNLFSLRKKILKIYHQQISIKNSKMIAVNTVFAYKSKHGFHYKLPLKESTPDNLILALPETLSPDNEEIQPLKKIAFIFTFSDGSPYRLETRIIRYQTGKENDIQMITAHTENIFPLKKRTYERADLHLPCTFSPVKIMTENNGEKTIYTPVGKSYEGMLEDISAGGCKLISSLPIKAKQYIYVEGPFNGKKTDSAIGIVLRTTKRSDGTLVLHIQFLKIDMAAVNRINAFVSKYDI